MKKSNVGNILLIDDDHAVNNYHKLLFSTIEKISKIDMVFDGEEAENFISNIIENEPLEFPSYVFLDLNMAGRDGFDFLDYYQKLDQSYHTNCKVIVLTTSESPRDFLRLKKYSCVYKTETKPIKEVQIKKIFTDISF